MKLLKVHLFFFVLLCTMAFAMSVQSPSFAAANHHGGEAGCYGRRQRPNNGNGGNNNNTTTGGGQTGQTEQV